MATSSGYYKSSLRSPDRERPPRKLYRHEVFRERDEKDYAELHCVTRQGHTEYERDVRVIGGIRVNKTIDHFG